MKLSFSIFDPQLDSVHCCGIAGLYATLAALGDRVPFKWDATEKTVSLDADEKGLRWLLAQSFQLKQGVIATPATGYNPLFSQWTINAILRHPKSRKIAARACELSSQVTYALLESYAHQTWWDKKLFNKGGLVEKTTLTGWLYPGAAATTLDGVPMYATGRQAFLLLFSFLGMGLYKIKSEIIGQKTEWAIIVPQFNHLVNFNQGHFYPQDQGEAIAPTIADAGLQYMARNPAALGCEVHGFGKFTNPHQLERVEVKTIGRDRLEEYVVFFQKLPDRSGLKQDGTKYFLPNLLRGAIASNLATSDRAWYEAITDLRRHNERSGEYLRLYGADIRRLMLSNA